MVLAGKFTTAEFLSAVNATLSICALFPVVRAADVVTGRIEQMIYNHIMNGNGGIGVNNH
jgi:hypothetical protein